MIKRTLYFGNEAYLSTKDNRLVVSYPNRDDKKTIAIEDIGFLILDHYRLTITSTLLNKLLQNNTAIISCDQKHLPLGMFLNLDGHSQQLIHLEAQISTTKAKKDRLWKQVIQAKIENQARLLQFRNKEFAPLFLWSKKVSNGDPNNFEARAAAYYWPRLLYDMFPDFRRDRFGDFPNSIFNYGYTILRGVVARSLVASGLLPTLGIHHHNKYTSYGLADDIMEPYRPIVDQLVIDLLEMFSDVSEFSKEIKLELLKIPVLDVVINKQKSPLMLAVQQTTSSLQKAYAGELKDLKLPTFARTY